MCCIWTIVTWIFETVAKCWTMLMSCTICLALIILLLFGAIAGVALGYNYSLSEFINMKENNVSVYFKRGIFDEDDTQNKFDTDNHGPNAYNFGPNVAIIRTEGSLGNWRSDGKSESIAADDIRKFEDALIRFTAKPKSITTQQGVTIPDKMTMPKEKTSLPSAKSGVAIDYGYKSLRKSKFLQPPGEVQDGSRKHIGDNSKERSNQVYQDKSSSSRLSKETTKGPSGHRIKWFMPRAPDTGRRGSSVTPRIPDWQSVIEKLKGSSSIAVMFQKQQATPELTVSNESIDYFDTRTIPAKITESADTIPDYIFIYKDDREVDSLQSGRDYDYYDLRGLPVRKRKRRHIKEYPKSNGKIITT